MNSSSRVLVHQLFASHLQMDETSIKDAHGLEELGLDPLDVVLVVLRLEDFDRGSGDFPVGALARARTVGDVVTLVDLWWQRETTASSTESASAQRGRSPEDVGTRAANAQTGGADEEPTF